MRIITTKELMNYIKECVNLEIKKLKKGGDKKCLVAIEPAL